MMGEILCRPSRKPTSRMMARSGNRVAAVLMTSSDLQRFAGQAVVGMRVKSSAIGAGVGFLMGTMGVANRKDPGRGDETPMQRLRQRDLDPSVATSFAADLQHAN